ncbi:unnamed protein product [Adineta steineri]|uniref:Uncharacterized protein n=1 Tax=Adineta steineri TaxID=433720 RepID=A0A819SDE6_9BILA|nr:unnamed protein product [Adineta steineri]CAF4062410.1 unnamed protein product [Adineta steineri]
MNNTTETNINLLHVSKVEEDGQHFRDENFKGSNTEKDLFKDICQSSSIFIFLIVIAIIPILQIFIGWRYSDACPINKSIPYYLIVAGIISLLLVILISITQLISRIFGSNMFEDANDITNPNRTTMLFGCGICSIMCINLSLFVFLLGWSFAGLVWIIEVWHRVQYHRIDSDDYCNPLLYQFTFSLLLLTATFKILFFCFVCRKTCVRVSSTRRKDTTITEEC